MVKNEKHSVGGDGEIRTRGRSYLLRRFSKPLVSATHPRLQWRIYKFAVKRKAVLKLALARLCHKCNRVLAYFLYFD
jgi:hypothetical protein